MGSKQLSHLDAIIISWTAIFSYILMAVNN